MHVRAVKGKTIIMFFFLQGINSEQASRTASVHLASLWYYAGVIIGIRIYHSSKRYCLRCCFDDGVGDHGLTHHFRICRRHSAGLKLVTVRATSYANIILIPARWMGQKHTNSVFI